MTVADILRCRNPANLRPKNDLYNTPRASTLALVKVEAVYWPKLVWEPCFGKGSISDVMENYVKVVKTDLTANPSVDFLLTERKLADAIVTNPPYSHATAFIRHAHGLGIPYHAWLLKADFFNAKRARKLVDDVGYPARIWALTERPDFLGQGAPTMNCSWYVFDGRRHKSSKFNLLSIYD